MSTSFPRRLAFAGFMIFGAIAEDLTAGASPATAGEAQDFAQGFTAIHVQMPDAAMQPSSSMTCYVDTGPAETHCWQSFTDQARGGQTDYVAVDVMSQPTTFDAIKTKLDAQMQKFGDPVSEDESFTITTSTHQVLQIPEICEQADNGSNSAGSVNNAICEAALGNRIVVTSVVAPSLNERGIDLDQPADIARADALDENAVEGVRAMLQSHAND
jgi:hypothetical protein